MSEDERVERILQNKPPIVARVLREMWNRKKHFGRVLTDAELKREAKKLTPKIGDGE